MGLNIPGLIATVVFYVAVLATGIWASRRAKAKVTTGTVTEVALLGGRTISLPVGIFTMTATWVGGGFILGTAEAVYSPQKGLVWALMPVYLALSFIVGGLVFAKPMREKKYITMMDPFQIKYGKHVATLMVIPGIIVDVLWVSCTLMALEETVRYFAGGTMSTILDLPYVYSVVLSAVVATIYTLLGGLYSVAYTDVVQLFLVFVALWLCVPFILLNPISLDISWTAVNHTYQPPWIGRIETQDIGKWLDECLALVIGGSGYQCFHQRILSASSPRTAQITCFAAAAMLIILGIPSILIGSVAASTDREMQWVIRIAVVVTAVISTGLTFLENSIWSLWILGADVAYCIVLPQLICAVFCPVSNGYGAAAGYFLGILLRLLSGEPLIGLPPTIHFPGGEIVDGVYIQQVPVRTVAMLFTLVCVLFFSYAVQQLRHCRLPNGLHVFGGSNRMRPRQEQANRNADAGETVTMMSAFDKGGLEKHQARVKENTNFTH